MNFSNKSLGTAAVAIACAWLGAYLLHRKPAAASVSSPVEANSDAKPHLAWKFDGDRAAFSSVVLGPDGTIYAASNKGIFAVSPDGQLKWHTQYGGISYLAVGKDGVVYAASMYGFVFGVSPDGTVSWKPGYGLIGFHAPPAIGSDVLLFANSTSDLFAFKPGSASAAWSQSTFRAGAISERSSLPGTAAVGTNSASAPEIYGDTAIIVPRQHWLQKFDSDGTPGWHLELTPGMLGNGALDNDGTTYVGDGTTLYAADSFGNLKWKYAPSDGCCIGSPVVDADGNIYFSSASSISALRHDRTVKWNVAAKQRIGTSPTLLADGSVYVGTSDGLMALNADGSEKWTLHTPEPGAAPVFTSHGTAYYACGWGSICAIAGINQPLMKSAWPRIYHDSQNTGNVATRF
jgi:hypothetical protein